MFEQKLLNILSSLFLNHQIKQVLILQAVTINIIMIISMYNN